MYCYTDVAPGYEFKVMLHNYINQESQHSLQQTRCDSVFLCPFSTSCTCDNRFIFCLRPYGSVKSDDLRSCSLGGPRPSGVYENMDDFNFLNSLLNLTNPVVFSGTIWPVSSNNNES